MIGSRKTYHGLSMDDYKAIQALSKHQLDLISVSIKKWQAATLRPKEQTKAMFLGSAFHDMVLLPELFSGQYIVSPKVDMRTNKGKEIYQNFVSLYPNKTFIDEPTMDILKYMKDAIDSNQTAVDLLKDTQREVSLVSIENGFSMKCRADAIKSSAIIDIKTTSTTTVDQFVREIYNLRYDVQAALYLDFFEMDELDFYLIVVQTVDPWDCFVIRLSQDKIDNGRRLYESDIKKYLDWKQNGGYSGISNGVIVI